ncbi:MAG: hypothetical protein M1840_005892 [Geoglossum simile]|nr:MAG: hypothetical protein M1840_005892 [Geoglossum simile]
MGWFWGSSDEQGTDSSRDAVGKLDPSLRDFLQKESATNYNPSKPPPTENSESYTDQPSSPRHKQPEAADPSDASAPLVPPQSLYADGRYAHIWKTYKPLSEIENSQKTEQDKLLDVLESHKYRKAEIGRAALENCAFEQWEVNDCFRSGSWVSRMTMCRKENHKLDRCYTMQAKFLKALGYLSNFERAPEVDEQIQMHADKLYHQMLDQEAAIERAKAEGLPIPTFEPLITISPPDKQTKSPSPPPFKPALTIGQLSPEIRAQLNKRLEGLTDKERELEEKAIAGEIAAGELLAGRLTDVYKEQERARQERKEQGKQTLGDSIRGLFGF